MKKIIFFATFFFTMVYWDIVIRLIVLISLPLAKRYLERRAPKISKDLFVLARAFMGMKVQRRTKNPFKVEKPFLIVSNHQSIIDIPFLYTCFPEYQIRFVAKEQLAHWVPLVSIVFRLQEHALVSRSGRFSQTMDEMRKLAGKSASKGFCPVVFPEGTRSRTGEVLPFHAGAVRTILSVHSMPVLCVAIDGGHQAAATQDFAKNLGKAVYRFKVLKLFPPPQGKKEISRLISESEKLIKAQVAEWHAKKKLPG